MLERIYSNTNLLLKPVDFHPGINIVLGRNSGAERARGINGIGKSSLVRLIDYVFLSNSAQKIFLQEKYDFLREEKHDIFLEFSGKGKKYFIRREFFKNSPVHFGERPDKLGEYTREEIRPILTDIFFPIFDNKIFFEGNRFRTIMDFFIKDDLENQKRSEPLDFLRYDADKKEKAIYNFYLLNLPTDKIINLTELIEEHSKFSTTIKGIELNLRAFLPPDIAR